MSKHRLKLLLSLVASILVLGYWGFYEPQYQLPPLPTDETNRQIDGFIIGAHAIEYDDEGLPSQELTSPRLTHYATLDNTLMQSPDMLVYRRNAQPVRILAEEGEIGPGGAEVLLRRQVSIVEQQSQGFSLETEFLRLEPDNDYAETDTAVTLRNQSGVTTSIGMKAYLADDRLQLLERVRGVYEPR